MTIKRFFEPGITGYLITLFAGVIMAFSFAPFSYFLLPIISLSLLLASWIYVPRWTAFCRGYLFGMGLFGVGVSWIYFSLHDYGNAAPPLAAFVTLLFVMILSLIPALAGYVFTRYFPKLDITKILCAFPALWTLFEWIKSWIFTGFPWLDVGYSQLNSPLRSYAPIFGVYGITFLVALTSALVVYTFIADEKKMKYRSLASIALIWIIGALLNLLPNYTSPMAKPMQVSLIQGDIPQMMKWEPTQLASTLSTYKTLTEQHLDSQLIVWPESAVPTLERNVMDYLNDLHLAAKKHNASVIVGIPTETLTPHPAYFNSLIVLGQGHGSYNKRLLVPFGEFIPEKELLRPLLQYFNFPLSDTSHGHNLQRTPFANGILIAPLICYESAFSEYVRNFLNNANLIVTLSDDMWFGNSWALDQHLQMTQMRALETGRYALFVNNNGSSAIINEFGHILLRAPNNTKTVLTGEIQPLTGWTPWLILGMNLNLLIILGLIAYAARIQYVMKYQS